MGKSGTARGEADGRQRGRCHWTERQARAIVAEQRASGEPLARFARRKGLKRQRLAYWVKRLAGTALLATPPAFVQIATTAAAPAPIARSPEPIMISVGQAVIRVDASHDLELVARLVDAIARQGRAARC